MASKRLSLMLEESGEEEDHADMLLLHDDEVVGEHDPQLQCIERRSAKRCKLYGKAAKPSSLESPLQRMLQRQISVSSCTLSPITELSHNMRNTLLDANNGTPKSSTMRSFNSVNSVSSYDSGNSLDDEYMAMFELEALDECPLDKLPGDLDALITGQLKTPEVETTNNSSSSSFALSTRSVRRCLSMTQQEPLDMTPFRHNSVASVAKPEKQKKATWQQPQERPLRKSMSMDNVDILNALGDEPELIGDLSKPCALPVLLQDVRHRDLKNISCETLARLLRGEFAELASRFKIIDCRYPYEFDGGHIRGAFNLYTREQIKEAFPASKEQQATPEKEDERNIYVFHCEFSSERGPKLLRFLRKTDRSLHTHNYPTLDYPELYLLHNGYKEFYSCYADLCEPCNYVPMLAPAHNEEYRLFRAKTKSWQCGDSEGGGDSGIGGVGGGGSGTAYGGGGSLGSSHGSAPSRSRTLVKSRSRLHYAE